MRNPAAIKPMDVRFLAPEDIEKYGDEWFTYDELAIMTMPARELIDLEREMDMPLVGVMNGFRESSVLGDTGAAWIAMRLAGRTTPWEKFDPAILLAEWRVSPGKAPEPASGSSDSNTPEVTDMVVLPTMPVAESNS
jgi:hypothetical protein